MQLFRINSVTRLFSCVTIFTIILFSHIDSSRANKRIVFPYDFIRFMCIKPSSLDLDDKVIAPTSCSWKFLSEGSNATIAQVTKGICVRYCTKMVNANQKGSPEATNDVYEGYVEVPEGVTAIVCEQRDGSEDVQLLDVQRVRLTNPLSSQHHSNKSSPTIVLQRHSDDFGARLGSHDVTNQVIKINGEEVSSLRLLCIHSAPVSWINVTESHRRIIAELSDRDKKWLHPKSGDLEMSWKAYLKFLLDVEEKSYRESSTRLTKDQVTYMTQLSIQNITNMTSRTYECVDNADKEVTSHISLRIENPRVIGPDEIQLIEQILGILDSMVQGKGNGREPWYTLGSLMSIILILFMYYCKKKLDQPQAPTSAKANSSGIEETEMRRLQQNSPQTDHGHHEGPVSVVAEQPTLLT